MEQLLSEERRCEEKRGEEKILSAAELIHWEKQTKKHNGKYVDAVQARLNGDLTGSFAQYFSNIDFSKFRPGVDPAQLLRMLTWMTEGYMNEKQRAGVPLRLEDILADYSGWEEMFRKIAYKEEYL